MTLFRLTEETEENKTEVAVKDAPPTSEAPLSNTQATPSDEPKKEAVKEIILKGPLGHAYTEALKLLLNKETNPDRELRQESVYQAIQANVIHSEAEDDLEPKKENNTYVYVYDGKRMDMGDINQLFDSVNAVKGPNDQAIDVIAVIENAEELLGKKSTSNAVEEMTLSFESRNIPLYFTRNGAMAALINRMKV